MMRWLLFLFVTGCYETPYLYDASFPAFDAGRRDVTCHIVDWLGTEQLIEHLDREPMLFERIATPICTCGATAGFATCAFNPGLNRFDGACTGCVAPTCNGGLTQGQGCSCDGNAFDGVVHCERDGSSTCECPSSCGDPVMGPMAARFSTCRCADGVPGTLDCPDGGVGACDCSRTRPFFGDGGR